MKMLTLNHVSLVSRDPQATAAFYERVFGAERQWEEGAFVFLRCGDTDLALIGGKPVMHRRLHIGFRVESRAAVDEWLAATKDAGAEIAHGPADYGDYYTFTCRDPDGYGVEVYFEAEPRGRTGAPADAS